MMRVIPKKNYLILAFVLVVTFLLVYYLYLWYDAYRENKLTNRIVDNYLEVINFNELNDYLVENPDTIIYVSKLEDARIREFEKEFKKVLKNNEIDAEILYMDVTKDLEDKASSEVLRSKYDISKSNIPVLLIFKAGQLYAYFDIKGNNYDLKMLKVFIEQMNVKKEQ